LGTAWLRAGGAPAQRGCSLQDGENAGYDVAIDDPIGVVRELVRLRYGAGDWRSWRNQSGRLTEALAALSPGQARLVARELWESYEPQKINFVLGQLNAFAPGAVSTISSELIAAQLFHPGWLYLGLDSTVAEHLLKQLSGPGKVLECLAWVANDAVLNQIGTWRQTPADSHGDMRRLLEVYASQAGWELTSEGRRRDLYLKQCYELAPADRVIAAGPVKVSTEHEGQCKWCGRPLECLLDIDLTDPRCSFLGPDGQRLRIAHCVFCSSYARIFTAIDLYGRSAWSQLSSTRPAILDRVRDDGAMPPPRSRTLILGAQRRTPFEALGRFMLDETGISQLGGHPEWIQDADYPSCPSCLKTMECIGQVSWEDFMELAEGVTYAFRCSACGLATTNYQQT
jgi:hypothetical protein